MGILERAVCESRLTISVEIHEEVSQDGVINGGTGMRT